MSALSLPTLWFCLPLQLYSVSANGIIAYIHVFTCLAIMAKSPVDIVVGISFYKHNNCTVSFFIFTKKILITDTSTLELTLI